MIKLSPCILSCFAVSCALAQSLKPESPAPLRAGVNKAIADSMVGPQYWSFRGEPGEIRLLVRFKSTMGPLVKQPLTVTLYDEARTWHVSKTLYSDNGAVTDTTLTAKLDKSQKAIVLVAPPSGGLLRSVGDYELEATGTVQFEQMRSERDPIIGTYQSKVNNYGAVKFLANGAVQASDGSGGMWKVFDAETRIYTVTIGQFRWSLKFLPGRGLVDPGNPTSVDFQALR